MDDEKDKYWLCNSQLNFFNDNDVDIEEKFGKFNFYQINDIKNIFSLFHVVNDFRGKENYLKITKKYLKKYRHP